MEYMHPSQPGNLSARQITAVDRKSLVLGFGNLSNSSSRIRRKGRCEGNVWGARPGGGGGSLHWGEKDRDDCQKS